MLQALAPQPAPSFGPAPMMDLTDRLPPDPYGRRNVLPFQDWNTIMLCAQRFARAAQPHADWARRAKKAIEYCEGKQWSDADLAERMSQKRPALTFNKIAPMVRLVHGYFIDNRTDIKYLPGNTGFASAEIAAALSHTSAAIAEMSQLPYIDVDNALIAIMTGRAFYDFKLDFTRNLYGEGTWCLQDPFSTYLDPDGEDYDLNKSNYIIRSRWVSLDEIEATKGRLVSGLIQPFTQAAGMAGNGMALDLTGIIDEIAPFRSFGGEKNAYWAATESVMGDWVDTYRKNVRMIDVQCYMPTWRQFWVDLDTGEQKPVRAGLSAQDQQKILDWAKLQGRSVRIVGRQTRRVRWIQMVGDIMIHDGWSPYETFSTVGYFPYFRQGQTRGMVEDLMDPQDGINKHHNNRIEIQSRTANGGWMYAEGQLSPEQEQNLLLFGARPGVHVKYKVRNGTVTFSEKPSQIGANTAPIAQQQLELDEERMLNEIAGINRDAMGMVDKVQSGAAIQAKQRQALVGLGGFIANYSRTKELQGRKQLEVIQGHYKSPRILRVIGHGSEPVEMMINQMTAEGIVNDVSLGSYNPVIDETPIHKSFLEATFEELLRMYEMGIPVPAEDIIEASSYPKKESLKIKVAAASQAQAQAAAAAPPAGAEPRAANAGKPGRTQPGPVGADGGNVAPNPNSQPPA